MIAPDRLPPFRELYRTYFDDVWSALLRLGVPHAILEDAVHDVFVVVHRRTDDFEGRCTVRTWLLGISRRIAYRYRRTAARTERRHHALSQVGPTTMSLDEHVARQEGWRALAAFLEQLDERKREAFVLGELEQLGRRELGAALGVSPDTAYSRLRAARARFAETFTPGPRANAALAAGRTANAAPPRARQRIWMVLMPSLAPKTIGVLWATKVAATTAGLALGGLVVVTAVASEVRSGDRAPSVVTKSGARTSTTSAKIPSGSRVHSPSMSASVAPTTPATAMAIDDYRPSGRARRSSAPVPATAISALPPPLEATDPLLAETALLQQARAALASSDAARALALVREHHDRFPDGLLIEEREASELRARCALGQHDRALDDAERFARTYPHSAYLDMITQACAPR